MDYTDEQLSEKFATLPEELQDAVLASDLDEKVSRIAEKHGLHVDQTGQLVRLTNYVLLGLVPTTGFADELKKKLLIDDSSATLIVQDVNDSIFLPIRHYLIASPDDVVTTSDESSMNRDEILSGIENPTPAVHPITVDTGGPAMQKEILPRPPLSQDAVAKEFIGGSLTGTVNLPAQKTTVQLEPTLKNPTGMPPKPKGYPPSATDPYREPVA